MSLWEDHAIEEKVATILRDAVYPKPHALGQPFLSVYQIAAAFVERFPETFEALGYKLGGQGAGTHFALTTYLGKQLCDRIVDRRIDYMEAVWLSNKGLRGIEFASPQGPILASVEFDQPLFRLRE